MRDLLRLALAAASLAALAAGLFLLAGGFDWAAGWLFLGWAMVCHGTTTLWLWRHDAEVLRHRARPGKGTKRWDFAWLAVFALLWVSILLVAAWEARSGARPGWAWTAFGALLYLLFVLVLTWAMAVNPFFEKTVRIQADRGHRVVDRGPYRWVRHPGYAAIIPGFLFGPALMLGSRWALLPAALAAAWVVVRTALEDRTLRRELEGYADYGRRVRYRLVPGLW